MHNFPRLTGVLFVFCLLSGMFPLFIFAWKDHPELPENFRRGNLRMVFSVVRPDENFYAGGCNFYRGSVAEGYDQRGIWAMSYISPTDFFWHDRLWREHYARGTELPLAGTSLEFILNMDQHYPALNAALVQNPDGSDKIIRKGYPSERKVGCRNHPLWREYRKLDTLWQFEGSAAPGIREHPYFGKLPLRERQPEIRGLFIDNAGIIPCFCSICKKKLAELEKEYVTADGDKEAVRREFDARTPASFNHLLHQTAHSLCRVMMPNYTSGCAFANLRQAQIHPPDAICWELTYQHPPWGRCLPYYKRGLAASGGVANAAVTLEMPLPGTYGDAMPLLVPDFTRMALAEGMATQGSYILKGELTGDFFPASRQYNRFNQLFPEIYNEAQQAGRTGIVCAVRSGLYSGKGDSLYDRLTNRLSSLGIPVEVLTEDELDEKLRARFDVLIVPDLAAASPEMLTALHDFALKGGGILISETCGAKNLQGKIAKLPEALKLKQYASKKNAPVLLLEDFGDSLSDFELLKLILMAAGGELPQRLIVADQEADFMVNALKKDQLESYHIVNYTYSVVPFELPDEQGVAFSIRFPSDHCRNICVYGSSQLGTGKLRLMYQGKLIGRMSFAGNSWQHADVSSLQLPAGMHDFVLCKEQGEVVIYPESGGIVAATTAPAQVPLKARITPLVRPTLRLMQHSADLAAAIITPDGESEMLPIKKEHQGISVTPHMVRIYSVILLSHDEVFLRQLVDRANEERSKLSGHIPVHKAEALLAGYPGNHQYWLAPGGAVKNAGLPETSGRLESADGFFAPPDSRYTLYSIQHHGMPALLVENTNAAAIPFVVLNASSPSPIWQEFRNGTPAKGGGKYAGNLYLFGQALTPCELEIIVNGNLKGILTATATVAPQQICFDLKQTELRPELNQIMISCKKGVFVLAVDPDSSATSNLSTGAYCLQIAKAPPDSPPKKPLPIPLADSIWQTPGSIFQTAVFLTPEHPAILLNATATPDSKTFVLPEISSYAMIIPSDSENTLIKMLDEHDTAWRKNTGTISRQQAKTILIRQRGLPLKVELYTASSNNSAPQHSIELFNKQQGKGFWIDGTPHSYPDWVEAKLANTSLINKVQLSFPNKNNVPRKFEVQIYDEEVGNWRCVSTVENSQEIIQALSFPDTITNRVRIVFYAGGEAQKERYSVLGGFEVRRNDQGK